MKKLQAFLQARKISRSAVASFSNFETELRGLFAAAECEVLGEELGKFDVDVPYVEIGGVMHRQVARCEDTYMTAEGPVRVERSLYANRRGGERAACPMELGAGIVEGRWTPQAAKQSAWVVAHLPPQVAEDLFKMMGHMTPSKSSLDRLPKQLSQTWEDQREPYEAELRAHETVPATAVTVAISLDGVMVPMKDGKRAAKRVEAVASGKRTRGPAGYAEVGCATLSFYDRAGEMLATKRMARMPEAHKATLKEMLTAELAAARLQRPDLQVVKLADGAKDNWTYLAEVAPDGLCVVDFYHAGEHLHQALCEAYGESTALTLAQFHKLRHLLRHDDDGVEKVIRALAHLCRRFPRRTLLARELAYFRARRHLMRYATHAAQNLPIGSGIVEAACKTLATQRLKGSGMRWRHEGGQAILTLRALIQSDRFELGWEQISAAYVKRVGLPKGIIPLNARRK